MNHIFYNTQDLPLVGKTSLLKYAHELSYDWRVDILNCNISFARRKIEMDFETVLKKLDDSCHFSVIHRFDVLKESEYGEVGFCTMKGIDYYLWIYLTVADLEKIINQYRLKKLP